MKKFLSENEIGNEIYYPIPFHLQECFQFLNHKKGDFPMSEFCADTSLAVPIYPELTTEMITFVVDKIAEFLNK